MKYLGLSKILPPDFLQSHYFGLFDMNLYYKYLQVLHIILCGGKNSGLIPCTPCTIFYIGIENYVMCIYQLVVVRKPLKRIKITHPFMKVYNIHPVVCTHCNLNTYLQLSRVYEGYRSSIYWTYRSGGGVMGSVKPWGFHQDDWIQGGLIWGRENDQGNQNKTPHVCR